MLGVIHIGAEKTGTTTLQETFHLNRVRLSRNGIYYPQTPGRKQHSQLAFYGMDNDRENLHTRNHSQLGSAHRDNWRKTFADTFDREISGAATSHDHLLISTELFHSQLVSTNEIERIKSLLDPWCSEYRIVFYMRRQDQLATSLYSTRLRTGGTAAALLPDSTECCHYYDYRHVLDLWGGVFGLAAQLPRVFEKVRLQDQDLVTDFFSAARLRVDATTLQIPAYRNSALSRDAQTFLRRFNQCTEQLSLSSPQRHRRAARNMAAYLEETCDGPPSLPSRAAARGFCEPYRKGNEAVAREFFSRDSLFEDDFGMYPEREQPPDSLDLAQTMEMVTRVIHHQSNHSLWLDQQRIDRLLMARNRERLIDMFAFYLDEVSPELAAQMRRLAR